MNRITATTLAAAVAAAGLSLGVAPASAEGDAAAGKKIYETNCLSCHGPAGKGKGPVGAALNPSPRDFTAGNFKFDPDKDGTAGTDTDLAMVIENGAAAYGGSPLMAPWPTLSDQDVQNVIAYIRSMKSQ